MKNGFVFGKYYPFHLGHKALIDFALTQCEVLYIVICASETELIDAEIRAGWIRKTYAGLENIRCIELNYDESIFPNTSVSSKEVSKIWSQKFKAVLPKIHVLITSEKYGEYLSNFMQIEHVYFDESRKQFPISSTIIRANFYENWALMPPAVQGYYQKKIFFLGTESTGKTIISDKVYQQLNATLVTETARDLIANSNQFTLSDLEHVGRMHAKEIEIAESKLKPFVLVDTDIYMTLSYAQFEFGAYFEVSDKIFKANRGDIRFYLANDCPFIQDGTRLTEERRNKLDRFHKQSLAHFNIPIIEIFGTWDEKINCILALLLKSPFD